MAEKKKMRSLDERLAAKQAEIEELEAKRQERAEAERADLLEKLAKARITRDKAIARVQVIEDRLFEIAGMLAEYEQAELEVEVNETV